MKEEGTGSRKTREVNWLGMEENSYPGTQGHHYDR